MHELYFSTPDPLDHCPRTLDFVRRMGFALISVCAVPIRSGRFAIRMNFMPHGDLAPEVLANRVAGLVGVAEVQLAAISAG